MTFLPIGTKVKELGDLGYLKWSSGHSILTTHPATTCEKSFGLMQTGGEFAERWFQSQAHMMGETGSEGEEKSDFACKAAKSKFAASFPAFVSVGCKAIACARDEREPRLVRLDDLDPD